MNMFGSEASNVSAGAIWSPLETPTTTTTTTNDDDDGAGSPWAPEGCVWTEGSHAVPWDNQHNLIPKRAEVVVNILTMGVLLPSCFCVSVFTNVVNMVVFHRHGLRERINLCLFTLSALDLLYVAAAYGYNSDVLYVWAVGKEDQVRPMQIFFFQNCLVGLIGSGSASQVVSTAIAIERCLCVTRPLLVKNLLSTKKTAVLLWSLSLVLMAGVFVSGMRYTVKCVFDASSNTTHFQFFPSQFYLDNTRILYILDGVVYGSLLPGVCAICVTVCTVLIVVNMKKLSLWRASVSSASDSLTTRDLAVTRMIVGTSVFFIVCIVPSMAVRIILILPVPGLRLGGLYENLYSVLLRMFYLSSVINSSFNFFVYYCYGSKFRQTVQQLFSSWVCCSNKERNGHKTECFTKTET